jgi:hypothetical protein
MTLWMIGLGLLALTIGGAGVPAGRGHDAALAVAALLG